MFEKQSFYILIILLNWLSHLSRTPDNSRKEIVTQINVWKCHMEMCLSMLLQISIFIN